MKNIIKQKIPQFKTEREEIEFWAAHDSAEYINWSKSENIILPKLKPALKTISIRLPVKIIEELKLLANKKDVPYQSLLKILLAEKVKEELQK